jgi:hypothetical protein
MMELRVPILISFASGMGMVLVEPGIFFCMKIWLPFCLASAKPDRSRMPHTSRPDRTRSLPNRDLQSGNEDLIMKSIMNLLHGSSFKE